MKLYAGNAGSNVSKYFLDEFNVGLCLSFPLKRKPFREYFGDNGAFSAWRNNTQPDWQKVFAHFQWLQNQKKGDFFVIPDKVTDAKATFALAHKYWHHVPKPRYLAIQDGMEGIDGQIRLMAPNIQGLFIGGTKPWKMAFLPKWVELARFLGLKIHVGRIGTTADLITCHKAGVNSVDSTSWGRNEITMNNGIGGSWNHVVRYWDWVRHGP